MGTLTINLKKMFLKTLVFIEKFKTLALFLLLFLLIYWYE